MEEGHKKEQASDFTDASNMTLVWSRCQQTCINEAVEIIRDIPDGHTYHMSVEMESDVLIPRDARPVVAWRENPRNNGNQFHERERIFLCLIASGIDHWVFVRDAVYSFLRGVSHGISSGIAGCRCRFNLTEITEGYTIARCRFSVHRPTAAKSAVPDPDIDIVVSVYSP